MFSNVINVGKDIANKIGNKLLNLSEVESMIKEATNDDAWGPQGSLMKEIADETFSSMNFNESMTFLWYRIFTERPLSVRRTYKGLVLLSYMILNGSDYVAIRCKDHIKDIRRLQTFSDTNGVPDASIRKKAMDICDLLSNPPRLQAEREKAKTNQMRLYGPKGATTQDSVESDHRQSMNSTSLGDFDSWEPKSQSIPSVLGETFINFVNTFTQNISGPPPTETHDNYDLPSYYESNLKQNLEKDTQEPIFNKPIDSCSKTYRKAVIDVQPISAVLIKTVVDDTPIIDFSEPEPSLTNLDIGLTDMTNNGFINIRSTEEDFGDFRTWDNKADISSPKPGNAIQLNEFCTNFDCLSQTSLVGKCAVESKDNKSASVNEEKSANKLGSTWNDMGSLKIDLDNVCGTKRSMFSKS